ncbi:nucleotidyl transferase AbiEii/AbiGii toxin family protein [Lactococcus lactis]|uniref:nucleotidyl transferase AbiEii/AbiGii toxin family protein n=1 Tax=Lactococcus lactis TaxID=1358 RepID=UPI0028910F38|nr:nucleotidyl transferase AbiEii/AbiGii toxin family protein [Lactococcus lactis]MDT2885271.1 nucleotidyl transferase AbiEii/AbiGii toxin family protein [Lactococcus lactis]MDT2922806.1 nucleotidyl transferase AbiEii/AbiGii toxin family protein [Lactococcus lactis]
MTPDEIRNTTLKAIFSNERLNKNLVLKGGNALKLYGIVERESQDLDFSIKETIRFTEKEEGKEFQKSISEAFIKKGYFVNDFKFISKPKKRHESLPPFWGGYKIIFTLLDTSLYQDMIASQAPENMKELNRYAIPLEGDGKKIEIDLSYDEYVDNKLDYDLDGTKIYLYSPIMIVYEKIRASCQQLDEYPLTRNKTRARDLYDIYKSLTNSKQMELREQVLSVENFYILENIFRVKEVPFSLMKKLETKKEDLKIDYEEKVLPQVSSRNQEDFEFIFDYNQKLFNDLYKKYDEYQSSK